MSSPEFWAKPKMHIENDLQDERKVGWLELFFDLVFVVVIAQLSAKLSHNISTAGIIEFLFLFIPVWWSWIGCTYYSERLETQGIDNRIFTFLKMLPVAGMAIFVSHGMDSTYIGFVLSYTLSRALVALLWQRGGFHYKPLRPITKRLGIGHGLALFFYLLSIVSIQPYRFIFFGIGLLIDILTPMAITSLQKELPRHSTSKLAERFGLFVIIVLGEIVVGVINGIAHELTEITPVFTIVFPGMTLAFGIWWLYFDSVGNREPKYSGSWLFFWSYLHFALVAGIVMVGSALHGVAGSAHMDDHFGVNGLLVVGVAVILFIIGVLEGTLRRGEEQTDKIGVTIILRISSGIVVACSFFWITHWSVTMTISFLLVFILMNIAYNYYTFPRVSVSGDEMDGCN